MTEVALSLANVAAGYGATQVLNGVSFEVGKSERLAILGRNGVGKTTTLATIMGHTRVHAGEICLWGRPVTGLETHARSRLGLGLVPQTRDIFPSLTVEENLLAAAERGADLEMAYDLFPRLKERRRNGGTQLSGGEQQMLSIARALLRKPDVLMLDEPLEGLAPVICDGLMQVFERLSSERGLTVILVEQHVELALEFASRALIIDSGEIVHEATTEALRRTPEILERHLGVNAQAEIGPQGEKS